MTGIKRKTRIRRSDKIRQLHRTKQRRRSTNASRLYRTKQSRRTTTKKKIEPTPQSYNPLHRAAVFFNEKLFGKTLPPALVTFQRHKRAYGFFAERRFRSAKGTFIIDEIALNPTFFAERGAKKVLSTLGHEQCHQWQKHFGKTSRPGYHNKEWAEKMREIGLIPSDTGRRGGKPTGQRVSHYIERGGAFDRAADALIAKGFRIAFVERVSKQAKLVARKKAASKTPYHCPKCLAKAWAKPGSDFMCRPCQEPLVA